jgi:hypothetical protein
MSSSDSDWTIGQLLDNEDTADGFEIREKKLSDSLPLHSGSDDDYLQNSVAEELGNKGT